MHSLEDLRAGRLAGARHLKLAAGLTEFPREIFTLVDTLEVLDLAGNALTQLPDDLPRLGRLRILFCSGSPFEALPEVLGACPRLEMIGFRGCGIRTVPEAALPAGLRWLILTENRIEALPAAIGRGTCGYCTISDFSSGALPPRAVRKVETPSATFDQSSPVLWVISARRTSSSAGLRSLAPVSRRAS